MNNYGPSKNPYTDLIITVINFILWAGFIGSIGGVLIYTWLRY